MCLKKHFPVGTLTFVDLLICSGVTFHNMLSCYTLGMIFTNYSSFYIYTQEKLRAAFVCFFKGVGSCAFLMP